jgi:exonuclease I
MFQKFVALGVEMHPWNALRRMKRVLSAKLPRLARWQLGQANKVSHDASHDAEVVADGRRTPQLAIRVRVSDPYLA